MAKLKQSNRGSFVVFYGSNNLGKSTQTARLISKITELGHQSFMLIKYPIYELQPTGPKLNDILRGKNKTKIDPKSLEMQKLYAENRFDFQNVLIETLNAGVDVIAEDYIGTGIAWGLTFGNSLKELEDINFGLLRPDVEILLDGERFTSGIEKEHEYEKADQNIWHKNKYEFLFLAERYSWHIVKANQAVKKVSDDIWEAVKNTFHSI